VVLRSAVEGAIAIHAHAKDSGFVDQMVDAHYRSKRTLARVVTEKFGARIAAEDVAEMNKAIADADAHEKERGKDLADIKWEQVAERHCPELYHFFYRNFSSDGTHATISVLERFVAARADGEISHLKAGPDANGLVEVLSAASLIFIWAAGPFAETNVLSDIVIEINARLQEFKALPGGVSPM